MRSSKSRSRSKSNRNRSVGNVVNRVFDSSGPEGKVRGTPQQIIEKYGQLARDATLSNDRVAAENFQQHAEHYARLLGEAQREMDARREQQEREQRDRQREREEQRADRAEAQAQHDASAANDPSEAPQPDIVDVAPEGGDTGLVETPEAAPKKARRPRRPRAPKAEAQPTDQQPAAPQPQEAAPQPAPQAPTPDEAAE